MEDSQIFFICSNGMAFILAMSHKLVAIKSGKDQRTLNEFLERNSFFRESSIIRYINCILFMDYNINIKIKTMEFIIVLLVSWNLMLGLWTASQILHQKHIFAIIVLSQIPSTGLNAYVFAHTFHEFQSYDTCFWETLIKPQFLGFRFVC